MKRERTVVFFFFFFGGGGGGETGSTQQWDHSPPWAEFVVGSPPCSERSQLGIELGTP